MKQRTSLVDLERVHPQHLISGLWVAIALLGVGLCFLPPSASGDAWKILGTSAVGLVLSFGVTRLSERALALPRGRGLPERGPRHARPAAPGVRDDPGLPGDRDGALR
ncbi:MAG: hypothetical protein EOP37_12200 [Rubrivivax sp.]|nr:MAG: hypothetical protein EOP37_12200 [Rubrivivax sp.]